MNADARIEAFLYSIRTPEVARIFLDISFLAKWPTVIALLLFVSYALWRRRQWAYLYPFWLTLAGNQATVTALKNIIRRARPGGLLPYYHEPSFSFPSGHSATSVALYGFLLFLFLQREHQRARRMAGIALGVGLILLIGFSRIYLGEHFLTDVLGGYVVGLIWLYIGTSWARRRRKSL